MRIRLAAHLSPIIASELSTSRHSAYADGWALAPEYEDRRAHPAFDIDAIHVADFREDALGFIQRMPEFAQRHEIIG